MSTRKSSVTETVKSEPFKLDMPDFLKRQPDYTVELPGKHVGLIFKEKKEEWIADRHQGGGTYKTTDGYRYLVRKTNGREAAQSMRVGDWRGAFYASALDLQLAIESDAAALTPKTRTRSESEGYEG